MDMYPWMQESPILPRVWTAKQPEIHLFEKENK